MSGYSHYIKVFEEQLKYARDEFDEAIKNKQFSDVSIAEGNIEKLVFRVELLRKAEAFDRIVEERSRVGQAMYKQENPERFTDEAFWNIDGIIIDCEKRIRSLK